MLGERLMGRPMKVVPLEYIEGRSGRVPFNPDTNVPDDIFLADDLDMKKSRSRHIADHEISHVIDLATGVSRYRRRFGGNSKLYTAHSRLGKKICRILLYPLIANTSVPKSGTNWRQTVTVLHSKTPIT